MNIQHSSHTDQWGTPPEYIKAVRTVLGNIDLDAASSAYWNQHLVGADTYLKDALSGEPWASANNPLSVYLNPPGGKLGNKSLAGLFWQRLMSELDQGHIKHAIFMAFSAEALQSTQGKGTNCILDYPFCVPKKRIRFVDATGARSAPSHSNVVVYVPGTENHLEKFVNVFSELGRVRA